MNPQPVVDLTVDELIRNLVADLRALDLTGDQATERDEQAAVLELWLTLTRDERAHVAAFLDRRAHGMSYVAAVAVGLAEQAAERKGSV